MKKEKEFKLKKVKNTENRRENKHMDKEREIERRTGGKRQKILYKCIQGKMLKDNRKSRKQKEKIMVERRNKIIEERIIKVKK